jgi:hypothetical protein
VLVELVEQGLEKQKEKEKAFFALADRFRAAADPAGVKQLGDEMGRFVSGWKTSPKCRMATGIKISGHSTSAAQANIPRLFSWQANRTWG